MCQAFEGEQQFLIHSELRQIREKYEAYKRGEIQLTEDELLKMAVEKMMLEEG